MAKEMTSFKNHNPPSRFCPLIQVDKEVTFMVDNRDINFSLSVPREKDIGLPHKTYSKKHPVAYEPVLPFRPEKVNGSRSFSTVSKASPTCVLMSSEKTGKEIRKRKPVKSDTSLPKSPVTKKMRKDDTCMPSLKFNGRITDKSKPHKNLSTTEPSSDSDIEIIEEIKAGSSRSTKKDFSNNSNGKEGNRLREIQKRRNTKSLPSIIKPCYPSTYDVAITADIAPVIPSNSVIPDAGISVTNHNVLHMPLIKKWIYPTKTSDVSSVQSGKICSAKESERKNSDTSNVRHLETKLPQEKKIQRKRELKNLYANLNEISWAKEKGFQQMLSNSDHRHSERITAKAVDAGKSLRRLKAGSGNLSTVSNKRIKPPMSSNRQNKTTVSTNRQNKPSVSTNRQNKPSISTNKLSKALIKRNPAKIAVNRAKYLKQKLVLEKNLKVKQPAGKLNRKVLINPALKKPRQKVEIIVKQAQPNIHGKVKPIIKKKPISLSFDKNMKGFEKTKNVIGETSQIVAGKSNTSALKKSIKKEKVPDEPRSSFSREIESPNELKFMEKQTVADSAAYSAAMKKGSKLRVEIEKLEHTSLWSTNFCEAFSRYIIERTSLLMQAKNKDSIKAVFEELVESWLHNRPENSKIVKKKKPEEETLRSSVRQSECAFRYKEIVIKKHENYMQIIIVPNPVKQNSLSIEAMKELREAFLLAKKDSNCHAVLLNSSGTFFCTGIDLSVLVGNGKKQAAEEMASIIKDLVLTLGLFTKPVIAAVNGIAVGFGVTLLTLCDIVYASDKATFCIPANRLGYIPEGGIILTLPDVVGSNAAKEMMMHGRRYTADEVLRKGLVTEVLWHSSLMNEVIPRVQTVASQHLQVMAATKTMVRCQLWPQLKLQMENECSFLPLLWLDAHCQRNMKQALQTGWLFD